MSTPRPTPKLLLPKNKQHLQKLRLATPSVAIAPWEPR